MFGYMICSCLSAVEASSSWKGGSLWNWWTETCNRFVAEGRVEICFGFAGAENVAFRREERGRGTIPTR